MKDHKRHMDRLNALAKQVDEAKASTEETNRFVQQTQRSLQEARRHARVFDTASHDAGGSSEANRRRRHSRA